ncbi:MAG: CDP-alcohol phosphatidyltransferase family protein [Rhizomicrobium sp.]
MSGLLKHIPNLLTGMRLACAPALAMLLASGDDRAALGIFAFAGLSDAADGYLAKRFDLATRFGRFLDPAADKLLMLAAFLALALLQHTPVWLTVLVIARDVAIVAGILLARFLELPIKIEPLAIGKISTAVQIAYIGFVLMVLSFGFDWPLTMKAAVYITAAATIASWLGYGTLLLRALAARHSRVA